MMFDILQNSRMLLSYALAYVISVTFSGAIKAWIAQKAGDYTAEEAGFLTLDPLIHVDPVGMILVLLTGFGWGTDVPVDATNIHSPYRDLKILSLYYIQTIVHILFTTLAIVLLAGIEISQIIHLGNTALGTTFKIVLQGFMTFNIFLAMLKFIQSSMDLICMHLIERDPGSILYIHLGSLIVTMIVLLFVGRHMQLFFANISSSLALLILKCVT